MSRIEFHAVSKRFGARTLFSELTCDIELSGITFIVGKSGSGKSVLCKMAVGLLEADLGHIVALGQEVSKLTAPALNVLRKRMPYIVQSSALLDWLTIEENVALAGRHLNPRDQKQRTDEALERLGLFEWAKSLPTVVGPGLKKRAALARAWVLQPQAMLLDEPTTGLDQQATRQVNESIVALRRQGVATVVVSHDYEALKLLADRVVVIDLGRHVFSGSKEEFLESKLPEVRTLLDP